MKARCLELHRKRVRIRQAAPKREKRLRLDPHWASGDDPLHGDDLRGSCFCIESDCDSPLLELAAGLLTARLTGRTAAGDGYRSRPVPAAGHGQLSGHPTWRSLRRM